MCARACSFASAFGQVLQLCVRVRVRGPPYISCRCQYCRLVVGRHLNRPGPQRRQGAQTPCGPGWPAPCLADRASCQGEFVKYEYKVISALHTQHNISLDLITHSTTFRSTTPDVFSVRDSRGFLWCRLSPLCLSLFPPVWILLDQGFGS